LIRFWDLFRLNVYSVLGQAKLTGPNLARLSFVFHFLFDFAVEIESGITHGAKDGISRCDLISSTLLQSSHVYREDVSVNFLVESSPCHGPVFLPS
jgi:hypothetical protein